MKKLLLILIPSAFLFYVYNRSRLSFKIQGIKLTPFPAVVVQLINTTSIPAVIESIIIDVSLNNNIIGSVGNFNRVIIAANSKIESTLKIDLNAIGLSTLGYSWLNAENRKAINLTFNGTLNLDGLPMPIKDNYNLK